jgi:hypothetical protein
MPTENSISYSYKNSGFYSYIERVDSTVTLKTVDSSYIETSVILKAVDSTVTE